MTQTLNISPVPLAGDGTFLPAPRTLSRNTEHRLRVFALYEAFCKVLVLSYDSDKKIAVLQEAWQAADLPLRGHWIERVG